MGKIYILVIEDIKNKKIIATGSLISERKFVRDLKLVKY